MRRLSLLAIPVLLAATACVDEAPTELEPQLHRGSAARAPGGQARYEVSLYNLTDGQPFTPPLSAMHRRPADLFEVGEPAIVGGQQIAENGNLDPMLEALEDDRHVLDVVPPWPARSWGSPDTRRAKDRRAASQRSA